jgi:hypothetical protein
MKWEGLGSIWQQTSEGVKSHEYFYVYRVAGSYWVAGRKWLGEEVSYRIRFETAKDARDYCKMKDDEYWENRIEAIEA